MVQKVQIKRTSTDNSPPTGLQPGELAIEMGLPTRMWVGVPAINDPGLQKLLFDSSRLVPVTQGLIRVFTVSGLYTPTVGLLFAIVEVVAGGGGGGGTSGTAGQHYGGGGGGSGGYSRSTLTAAQIGASQPITIGAGGTGFVGSGPGNPGGLSSFGALVLANGGEGGLGSDPSGVSVGGGGAGGGLGMGDFVCAGVPGGNGIFSYGGAATTSGEGGSSAFGGGGHGRFTANIALVGWDGQNYGSGGSGGHTANLTALSTGGKGSNGVVVVTEFF